MREKIPEAKTFGIFFFVPFYNLDRTEHAFYI